jgi:hypothetical protein
VKRLRFRRSNPPMTLRFGRPEVILWSTVTIVGPAIEHYPEDHEGVLET